MANTDENKEIAFYCAKKNFGCGTRFYTTEYTTEDFPERDWHPWKYQAECTYCKKTAEQDHLQLSRWKSIHVHGRSGPATAEGVERVKAANKARDPSSYEVSRFNAISHGENCQKATLFPARPGKYDACEGCEHLDNGCGSPEMRFCQKRNEIFLQVSAAMQSGDPSKMNELFVGLQTNLIGITMDMARSIAVRGVELVTPELWEDKEDGRKRPVEYLDEQGNARTVYKVEVNPLIPVFSRLMKDNKMDLDSFGLTPERKEEDKQFAGNLDESEGQETLQQATLERDRQMDKLLNIIEGKSIVKTVVVTDAEVIEHESPNQ